MKIIAFIESGNGIENILRHCNLWKDAPTRPPPVKSIEHMATMVVETQLDYEFSHQNSV